MPFNDIEKKRLERTLTALLEPHRLPAYQRAELDFGFRIKGQSVELFEIRPMWRSPGEKQEINFAKATYVKAREVWRVFWRRADLKWHPYDPASEARSIEEFVEVVFEDKHACFFG